MNADEVEKLDLIFRGKWALLKAAEAHGDQDAADEATRGLIALRPDLLRLHRHVKRWVKRRPRTDEEIEAGAKQLEKTNALECMRN
jgi:hypothetical protein